MNKKRATIGQSLGEAYQAIAPYASAGWVFVVSVTVCVTLGWWLDKRTGVTPLFTLIGAALGIGIGIYNLVVLARQINKTIGKNNKQGDNEH